MKLVDQMLLWVVRQRGYVPVPRYVPRGDQAVREAREAAEDLRRRAAHLDAMADAAGITVPQRGKRHARPT